MAESLNALAEQLHRIEHKLDLVLEGLARSNPTTTISPVGDANHCCPLCFQPVTYNQDMFAGHTVRQCGCSTGVFSLNTTFAAPTTPGDTGKGPDNE